MVDTLKALVSSGWECSALIRHPFDRLRRLMCGIVGYIGPNEAKPFLLEGLRRLEYRGYDSAGVAILNDGRFNVVKIPGRIAEL